MTREDAVKLWKRIQYYRAIGRVQWEHRDYLSIDDPKFMPKGLRSGDLRETMKSNRLELKERPSPNDHRRNHVIASRHLVKHVMGLNMGTKRDASVGIGGRPQASRTKSLGAFYYTITVGHMWRYKVYEKLYRGTTLVGEWLILSADKIRVNDKLIDLYEVDAYNYETDERTTAYVAQTKTEKRHTAFGKTVKQAVSRATALLNDELDNAILGEPSKD